ncbi:hypothetical protein BDQ17DRAFT_1425637 [Cyathus striatus]|nr:hypothetical protein BDQ17DRAFT_1425637 [Cyathus striatus]
MDKMIPPQKCGKAWCKQTEGLSPTFKNCSYCRKVDRKNKEIGRARAEERKDLLNKISGQKCPRYTEAVEEVKRACKESMLSESDTDKAEYEKERLVDEAVELFTDAEDFFTTIQSNFIASSMVEIHGTYHVEDNNDIVDKEQIQIVAKEIWRVTGYQFT